MNRPIIRRLAGFAAPYKALFIAGMLLGLAGSFLNVLIPDRVKYIASLITENLGASMDFAGIWTLAAQTFTIILLGFVTSLLGSWALTVAGQKTVQRLRSALNDKADRVKLNYFDTTPIGDTVSRMTSDAAAISAALSSNLGKLSFSFIIVIGCIVMMLRLNAVLAVCSIVSVLLGFFINTSFTKLGGKAVWEQRRLLGSMNGMVNESINGHLLIKAFNGEDEVLEQFGAINRELSESIFKSQFFISIMMPFMDFVGYLTYVVICIVGGALIIKGSVRIDTIAAFILYAKMMTSNITQMVNAVGSIQPAFACAGRVFEFLDLEEETDEGDKSVSDIRGDVEFRNVRFGYVEGQTIIKDFSAHIRPGMKVAVVGPTGAGKSTLINLLMRFYELNGGSILIDGVPITDMPRKTLHEMFAMVLQETWTFEGSIRENIVYSTPDIDEKRLDDAIEAAGIRFMVDAMPEGANTCLSEKANVSAGQKQLITIARAMLKNAPILILDEATSSVDTRTEGLIQKAIDAMTKGHTSFVIAHRLSTIRNADVIFVLKEGDIVETGTHEELLKAGGFYSELYRAGLDAT